MVPKRFFLSFLCLFIIAASNLPAYAKMMSVKGDKVRLRSGPGTKYSIKWEYGAGFPLKVILTKNGWYKVSDFENDVGWIKKNLLTSTPHMVVKANKNKIRKINIRSGPGTRFKIIGKAYYGVVFETVKQSKGWAKVKHDTGLEGWVKRSLLWGF